VVSRIDPFTDVGLAKGWRLDESRERGRPLDCQGTEKGERAGSPYAVGIGTGVCGRPTDGADACWSAQFNVLQIWCLAGHDPSSTVLTVLPVRDVFEDTVPFKRPRPMAVELADGSQWSALPVVRSGAWQASYECRNDLGVCLGRDVFVLQSTRRTDPFDRSGPTWTVRVGAAGDSAGERVAVAQAWFLAGRRWYGD